MQDKRLLSFPCFTLINGDNTTQLLECTEGLVFAVFTEKDLAERFERHLQDGLFIAVIETPSQLRRHLESTKHECGVNHVAINPVFSGLTRGDVAPIDAVIKLLGEHG